MSFLFLAFLSSIPDLITNAVEANSQLAYLVICLAMFLENIVPPIPSEIIMPLGGFLVFQGNLHFIIVVFSGFLGTVFGALPWYYLGKLLNEKKISSFLERKGRFIGITIKDVEKSRLWFDKYGTSLVFWGRLVPGIRTLVSIPAGIELMPFGQFLIWTSFGSLIWVTALTSAGYFFGDNYQLISIYLDKFKIFVKPIFFLLILFLAYKLIKNVRKGN